MNAAALPATPRPNISFDRVSQVFTSSDGSDVVYDFDMDHDADVVTFVIDGADGVSATALFNALNAAATVTDNGTHTTISVGGASLRLLNVSANHPFNFDSLEGINDFSDGNYLYEAIDIVIV